MRLSPGILGALVLALGLAAPLALPAAAQSTEPAKYWIFLTDKRDDAGKTTVVEPDRITERAHERRLRRGRPADASLDAPLSPAYLNALAQQGVVPLVKSRWLNAVSARLDARQAEAVQKLPFVREVRPVARRTRRLLLATDTAPPAPAGKSTTLLDYGVSISQLQAINAVDALEAGINGTGVRIGILDSEYGDFTHPVFAQMVADGRLIADSNFVGLSQSSRHGRDVASVMVGFQEGRLIGPAYGAEVVAATTEYAPTETNQEEDNFVAGLEWLEAMGVDLVSASIGYNEFDAGQRSYSLADMDGDTGVTTVAADRAAELGVVFVTSAGNEGTSSWRIVTTPADGDSVIAVGAVNGNGNKLSFSSFGPTADGRIKPDVAALGTGVIYAGGSNGRGTSFSAPLVAGVVAQMLQVNPNLGPIDVRDILRATASQADNPDNQIGWGVVDAAAALDAAAKLTTSTEDESLLPDGFEIAPPHPNPFSHETILEVRAPANPGFVRLSVYNLIGQRVGVPFEGTLRPGLNRIVFRAENLPPGLYLYTLRGERVARSGKMVLVR